VRGRCSGGGEREARRRSKEDDELIERARLSGSSPSRVLVVVEEVFRSQKESQLSV
jgi:hypothetical protein